MDAEEKDIEIWITRSGFEELIVSDNVPEVTKRLDKEDEFTAKIINKWSILRKGYLNLASKWGVSFL